MILMRSAAKQLTRVNMYIPVILLVFLISCAVIKTPKTAPTGMIPISMESAAKELIVTLYSATMVSIGTEVIYLRLYPKLIALREMICPMKIIPYLLFNLSGAAGYY